MPMFTLISFLGNKNKNKKRIKKYWKGENELLWSESNLSFAATELSQ